MSGLALNFSQHPLMYKVELIVMPTLKIYMKVKFNNVYKDVCVFRTVHTQMLTLVTIIS